jgi:hypothetical protein
VGKWWLPILILLTFAIAMTAVVVVASLLLHAL